MQNVYYHPNCPDGNTCAWLWSKVHPNDNLKPLAPEIDQSEPLVFLDCCPRVPIDPAVPVLVIDHHKTVHQDIQNFAPHAQLIYSNEKCAAELVRDYLKLPPDPLIPYIADRDLWKWELPLSREVSAYIHLHTLEEWGEIDVEKGKLIGPYILKLINKQVEHIYSNHRVIDSVVYINSSVYQSELGERGYRDYPLAVVYTDRRVSLRSSILDCAAIAKALGGGGHKNAAGFNFNNFIPEVHGCLLKPKST
jgi:oligoribonuclease NrnB/cAMP/cGMP phosphodiesterase (DHH superfamily)